MVRDTVDILDTEDADNASRLPPFNTLDRRWRRAMLEFTEFTESAATNVFDDDADETEVADIRAEPF